MGNKLRVGIIGLGVGKAHAQSLLDCGNADVVALCDFDEDRLNQVSVDYPDCRTTIDATSILEDQNIDMVSIAAYDNYHYSYVVQALNNGKHIFVEKPFTNSVVITVLGG